MVNVGLVTGTPTPRARAAPRTKVVLPAPSSPDTRTTSPGTRRSARRAASASVSAGEAVSASAMAGPAAQDEPGGDERDPGQGQRREVQARARQLSAAARLGGRRRGGLLLLGQLLVWHRLDGRRLGLRRGLGGRLRLERVLVLLVARAVLRERCAGSDGDRDGGGQCCDAAAGGHAARWYRRPADERPTP